MIVNFRLNLEENRTKFLKPIEGNWKMGAGWAKRSPDRTVPNQSLYPRWVKFTRHCLWTCFVTQPMSVRQSISLPTGMWGLLWYWPQLVPCYKH